MNRNEARRQIIEAANERRRETNLRMARYMRDAGKRPLLLPIFSSASIQRAVCVVRHNHLVSDDVLVAAGFNPTNRETEDQERREAA